MLSAEKVDIDMREFSTTVSALSKLLDLGMRLPKLSLQVLEAFEQVAQSGSMRKVAQDMGLSISSVSHHIAQLEKELGVVLFDRSSRPFALTREGRKALLHLSTGLRHLRRATSEATIGGLLGTRSLRIGILEDFESNVSPDLAVVLASRMPQASLSLRHVFSHEVPDLVRRGELDVAIASEAQDQLQDLVVDPLVRDPFVIAAPAGREINPDDLLENATDLPFLRFNPIHLVSKQIETHLARHRISLPHRFAFDSVHSMMAVIANGNGWGIVTPLGCAPTAGYGGQTQLLPFPRAAFARRISLISRTDFDQPTAQAIAEQVRHSTRQFAIDPTCQAHPWLLESFLSLSAGD